MKVKGLNGKIYNLKLVNDAKKRKVRSQYHLQVRSLLGAIFPKEPICEEISLPGSGKLSVDFLLPTLRMIIEVQGKQHKEFTPFFHSSKLGFINSLQRDNEKRKWCNLNNFLLIELDYGRPDEWRSAILQRSTYPD